MSGAAPEPAASGRGARVVLAGANAGYIHCGMALRCLRANLGALRPRSRILETDAAETLPVQWVEQILEQRPGVVGFSVYVWNVAFVLAVLRLLKVVAPEVRTLVGGPQFDSAAAAEPFLPLVDAVVQGEAEGVIESLVRGLLEGRPAPGLVAAEPPDLGTIALPYDEYVDADIATRMIYVEASRGCPFRCAYCTSGGAGGVRAVPPERLLPALERLLERGVRHFKFLDRSFNHAGDVGLAVLDFFLERLSGRLTLHFELTPEPLPAAWRERLPRFPPGALHLEVGVQTWNPEVGRAIQRPVLPDRVEAALRFLIGEARADVHADLIAGLPGEDVASFAAGFDRLVRLGPAALQMGLLKRLPGTELERDARFAALRFAPDAPYEVVATDRIAFAEMRRLARMAHCWDLLYNRKRFRRALPLLWSDAGASPFERLGGIADWLHARHGRVHGLAPKRLAEALLALQERGDVEALRAALEGDARDAARTKRPVVGQLAGSSTPGR